MKKKLLIVIPIILILILIYTFIIFYIKSKNNPKNVVEENLNIIDNSNVEEDFFEDDKIVDTDFNEYLEESENAPEETYNWIEGE